MEKLLSILAFTFAFVDAARILCFYPAPFHSHQIMFHKLTEKLAHQGHELVVLAPISNVEKLPNVTIIDVYNLSNSIWDELSKKHPLSSNTVSVDVESFWNMIHTNMYPIVKAQLKVPEMQKIIKDEKQKFDLLLIEGCIRGGFTIGARFKAPIIIISSFFGTTDNYYDVGAAIDPIVFPDYALVQTWSSSLWDKFTSLYISIRLRLIEWKMEKRDNELIKRNFGDKAPKISEVKKNVQMMLLNVHHVWDYNRPVPNNVLYLGSITLKPPKPLTEDLKRFLDSSKNGVVFMSLGSKIKSSDLPSETIETILKVFKTLPYDFLWKWETDNLPQGRPKNVHFRKWLPQSDMLYHPKIKAFITHAGLQSTDEAIAARVPLVALPIWSDQFSNGAKYELHGIGVSLNIDCLNEAELKEAILNVIENPKYRENIDKLARIMEEERNGSLDKAIRWINHIAVHGGGQLRSPLSDLSFVQYYMLDVIAAIGILVLIATMVFLYVTKRVIEFVYKMYKKENKLKSQ